MPKYRKNHITFQEKELEILRQAVDKAQKIKGRKVAQSPEIIEIMAIIEKFLRDKKRICYGGTAINNILPLEDQFYDKNIEIPDYDFFSDNALSDAKELADLYFAAGYDEVEAKSGQHYGTYKVFVNFMPVADITNIDNTLYKNIFKSSILIDGIYYAPPNFLRMAMYLELSRPAGDVGRWEKVLKRLVLLNKNYPLRGRNCKEQQFQRKFEGKNNFNEKKIYSILRQTLIDQGVVFFGGFATSTYSHYMPKKIRVKLEHSPDFDVLSEDPKATATIIQERLKYEKIKDVKIIRHDGVGEIIAPHYEIKIGHETVGFIFQPLACHSYNVIRIKNNSVKIATIDTMLSFYLAFLYASRSYFDIDRILCMAQYLFKVQAQNRLEQKGVLKRFSINCFGKQETQESMRAEKAEKYKELQGKRNTKEYEEWFLRYVPHELSKGKKSKKVKKTKQHTQKTRQHTQKTRQHTQKTRQHTQKTRQHTQKTRQNIKKQDKKRKFHKKRRELTRKKRKGRFIPYIEI